MIGVELQAGLLSLHPLLLIELTAPGTVAVIAGMVGKVLVTTIRAIKQAPTHRRSTARQDGMRGLPYLW